MHVPARPALDDVAIRQAIHDAGYTAADVACFDCAQSCTACADGCLGEPNVENQVRCITTCQNCSDVCVATGRVAP